MAETPDLRTEFELACGLGPKYRCAGGATGPAGPNRTPTSGKGFMQTPAIISFWNFSPSDAVEARIQ